MVDWDIHREVATTILKGVSFTAAVAVAFVLLFVLLGTYPLITIMVFIIAVVVGWYFEEYRKAKRRREFRERTGGICG